MFKFKLNENIYQTYRVHLYSTYRTYYKYNDNPDKINVNFIDV